MDEATNIPTQNPTPVIPNVPTIKPINPTKPTESGDDFIQEYWWIYLVAAICIVLWCVFVVYMYYRFFIWASKEVDCSKLKGTPLLLCMQGNQNHRSNLLFGLALLN